MGETRAMIRRIPFMLLAAFLLTAAAAPEQPAKRPLSREAIEIRGRADHPCVNLTPADVQAARRRIEQSAWARSERDAIVKEADRWLEGTDAYWLGFLPEKGAAYAYGFTGCPICDGKTGTWGAARCSWDKPGKVTCDQSHVLPDADHPDAGKGYTATDGRIHYLVGQFNAWATEQWTTKALPALSQAYLLTGDERYADRGLLLLDMIGSIYEESTDGSWDYPSDPPSGRLARPWYQVARTLVMYVDYYDALMTSPANDKPSLRPGMARRENIEQHFLLYGAYYCYSHAWAGALHNGHADYLRGSMAVGCLLDVPEYIDAAVNGPFSIDVMLSNNIDRDGRYYETAPGYAMHARHLYLTYADPLRNLKSAEYPDGINLYDDPRLQATLTLPDLQIQMAGRRPNFGDCAPEIRYLEAPEKLFNNYDYDFAERLTAMASDPARKAEFESVLLYLAGDDLQTLRGKGARNWLLWHAAEPPAADPKLSPTLERRLNGSWILGMKGLALLRSGNQAALLRFGPSLNHGDPDDMGLLYYANGYELSYDIGYGLASTHSQIGWGSSTVSHALVTVNEKSQMDGPGGGGSLLSFASLPSVQYAEADSPLSYSAENVKEYRRALALTSAGYLVDCFRVDGGRQHDFGFGSLGTSLEPFGLNAMEATSGSLAEGVAWGQNIGADGDIKGQPNKPYWNPPPGNGYGFFFDVRRGAQTSAPWGGKWSMSDMRPRQAGEVTWDGKLRDTGEHKTWMRMHLVGDEAEPIMASAPGLYPHFPLSSYVIARRKGAEGLQSTFLAIYEPAAGEGETLAPRVKAVERIGVRAISVQRADGAVDILLFGAQEADSPYGPIVFDGDFAYLTGDGTRARRAETHGATKLTLDGRELVKGAGVIEATVTKVDADARAVELDAGAEGDLNGLVAVFSNPAWTRTSAYHIAQADGRRLRLETATLSLGAGRAMEIGPDGTILTDVPHEFSKTFKRHATRFFEGKMAVGRNGKATRIKTLEPGAPMKLTVEDASALSTGERFDYLDLAAGDKLRIALPATFELE